MYLYVSDLRESIGVNLVGVLGKLIRCIDLAGIPAERS